MFASAAFRDGKAGIGVVIRSAGQPVRMTRRTVRAGSRAEGAYRALLHGVWKARGTGARRIRVFCDEPAVVDQIAGRAEVPGELVGLYLQTRALLNAYRWSSVEHLPRERNTEAALAAMEALDQEVLEPSFELDDLDSLPLFSTSRTQ